MARGGSGPGGHNNHLTATTATPAELSKFSRFARDVFQIKTPDLHNAEEVEQAIIQYFNHCDEYQIRPGNMGLYAALGMSRQDAHNAITGKTKGKVTPEVADIIKKAQRAMSTFRESLALEGKLNPVTYIFMGKNYDGLEDQTKIEVTASTGPIANMTPEEIAKQIEADIPIDAEFTETDST